MFLDCSPVVLAVPVKVCSKCGEAKLLDNYAKNRNQCKDCIRVCHQEYCKTWSPKYYQLNRDRIIEKSKEYRATHVDSRREYQREYAASHYVDRSDYYRGYREKNRERRREYDREYTKANKERRRQYRSIKAEELRDQKKSYRRSQEGKQALTVARQRYRARKGDLMHTLTSDEWRSTLDYFGECCAVCGRPRGLWHTLAADHWIPIVAANCPGTVVWNIVPLCHGDGGCNNAKADKLPSNWLTEKYGKRKGRAILMRIEAFLKSRRPAEGA